MSYDKENEERFIETDSMVFFCFESHRRMLIEYLNNRGATVFQLPKELWPEDIPVFGITWQEDEWEKRKEQEEKDAMYGDRPRHSVNPGEKS